MRCPSFKRVFISRDGRRNRPPHHIHICWWLWGEGRTPEVRSAVGLVVLACWLGFAAAVRLRVVRPLQTMSNLLLALREGDFSFRARGARRRDPLGDVLAEINGL